MAEEKIGAPRRASRKLREAPGEFGRMQISPGWLLLLFFFFLNERLIFDPAAAAAENGSLAGLLCGGGSI